MRSRRARGRPRVVPEDGDDAARAVAVPLEDLDGRRLARAVGSEEAEHLAAGDVEVDPSDGVDVAVGLAQVADEDGGGSLTATRDDDPGPAIRIFTAGAVCVHRHRVEHHAAPRRRVRARRPPARAAHRTRLHPAGQPLGPGGAIPPAVVRVGAEVVAEQVAAARTEGVASIRVVATAAIRDAREPRRLHRRGPSSRRALPVRGAERGGGGAPRLPGATGVARRCPDGPARRRRRRRRLVRARGRDARRGRRLVRPRCRSGPGCSPTSTCTTIRRRRRSSTRSAPRRGRARAAAPAAARRGLRGRRQRDVAAAPAGDGPRPGGPRARAPRARRAAPRGHRPRFALHPERARLLPAAILLLEGATGALGDARCGRAAEACARASSWRRSGAQARSGRCRGLEFPHGEGKGRRRTAPPDAVRPRGRTHGARPVRGALRARGRRPEHRRHRARARHARRDAQAARRPRDLTPRASRPATCAPCCATSGASRTRSAPAATPTSSSRRSPRSPAAPASPSRPGSRSCPTRSAPASRRATSSSRRRWPRSPTSDLRGRLLALADAAAERVQAA